MLRIQGCIPDLRPRWILIARKGKEKIDFKINQMYDLLDWSVRLREAGYKPNTISLQHIR